jgi:hypothetical protein
LSGGVAAPRDVADGMTETRNRLAVDLLSKYGRLLTSSSVAVMSAAVVFDAGSASPRTPPSRHVLVRPREHWPAEKTGSSFCRMGRACRPTPRSRLD